VSKYGLTQHIRFFRWVDHERVAQLLRHAHVYVALPEVDGASAGLFEAMSVGAYPVVSDIDANKVWIEDGVNGRLVKLDDPDALARIIETLYQNQSAVWRATEANRNRVERDLDLVSNTRVFTEVFQGIAANEPPPSRKFLRIRQRFSD
jgi:glycosyltransferase involved in cell wall biosynthesis